MIWAAAPAPTAAAAVDRCERIAPKMSDDDDDPQRAPHSECIERLIAAFPTSLLALSYRLDHLWGEEKARFASDTLARDDLVWSDQARAHFLLAIALVSFGKDNAVAAARAEEALAFDPEIDVSRILAPGLFAAGRGEEAVAMLCAHTTGLSYELVDKARLLADHGFFYRALWLLQKAEARPPVFIDPMLYGHILEQVGQPELARQKYLAAENTWNKKQVRARLFEMDLSEGNAADASYQTLRDLGWWADPIDAYRLLLLRQHPHTPWHLRDSLGLLRLLLALLVIALVPLLWIVPLHYWYLWRRLRRPETAYPIHHFSLRHFWAAIAALFVAQLGATAICDPDAISLIFDRFAPHPMPISDSPLAAAGLWSVMASSVALPILLRRGDAHFFTGGRWSPRKSVFAALSALAFLFSLTAIVHMTLHNGVVVIDDVMRAIQDKYGLGALILATVGVAPLVEEVVFRAVALDALATQMPNRLANILQAALFASLHFDLSRFAYLFALGILCGFLRRRSGGLLPSLLLHAGNNLIAVIVLQSPNINPTAPPPPIKLDFADLNACNARAPLRAPEGDAAIAAALNNAAWEITIAPEASVACLRLAEQAIDAALARAPGFPGSLDTKATLCARRGRIEEAVDLERAALDRRPSPVLASQLSRFLASRAKAGANVAIDRGDAHSVSLSPEAGGFVLQVNTEFPAGARIYLRARRGSEELGVFRLFLGPGHDFAYHFADPALPDTATFEVALVDGRVCENCQRTSWLWWYLPHDPQVDTWAL